MGPIDLQSGGIPMRFVTPANVPWSTGRQSNRYDFQLRTSGLVDPGTSTGVTVSGAVDSKKWAGGVSHRP